MLALLIVLATAQPKAVVLELKSTDVAPEQAALLTGLLTTELGNALEVVSAPGLGCQDASCAPEIAGALGARVVVFGDVGKLGARYVANLSAYDSKEQKVGARASLQGATLEALADGLPAAVAKLTAPLAPASAGRARTPAPGAVESAALSSEAIANASAVLCVGGIATSVLLYIASNIIAPLAGAPSSITNPLLVPVAGPWILFTDAVTTGGFPTAVLASEASAGLLEATAALAAVGGAVAWGLTRPNP